MARTKTIKKIGSRGSRVHVFVEKMKSGSSLVRVQWREAGKRRTESFENTSENQRRAKATADGVMNRLQSKQEHKVERLTLHQLFEKYLLSKEPNWREATGRSERVRWRVVENVLGAQTPIELVTMDTIDEFRAVMRKTRAKGKAFIRPNQIAHYIGLIKRVYRFASKRGHLKPNPIADYENRLSKDEKRQKLAEYTPAEWAKIIAQFNYRKTREWRPWCALILAGILGPRQRALLGLKIEDIDLRKKTVRWRPENDKLGRDRTQPLPRNAMFAIRVALVWRRRIRYTGPWLFPRVEEARGDVPWTYAALVHFLHTRAEKAGVEPKPYVAMHGLRRTAGKNALLASGGDLTVAASWIGDTDIRTFTRSYVNQREGELNPIADWIQGVMQVGKQSAPEVVRRTKDTQTTIENSEVTGPTMEPVS